MSSYTAYTTPGKIVITTLFMFWCSL